MASSYAVKIKMLTEVMALRISSQAGGKNMESQEKVARTSTANGKTKSNEHVGDAAKLDIE